MKLKVIGKQNNSDMCVVCGTQNALSLGTRFYNTENALVVGLVSGREEHQSYPGRMHGGMISALLDETIGRAIMIPEPECFGVTSDMQVRFVKPVPLGEPLNVVGKLTRNTRLLFQAEGFIEDMNGQILATAKATYIKLPVTRIAEGGLSHKNWFFLPDENDVTEVEVFNADWFDRPKK